MMASQHDSHSEREEALDLERPAAVQLEDSCCESITETPAVNKEVGFPDPNPPPKYCASHISFGTGVPTDEQLERARNRGKYSCASVGVVVCTIITVFMVMLVSLGIFFVIVFKHSQNKANNDLLQKELELAKDLEMDLDMLTAVETVPTASIFEDDLSDERMTSLDDAVSATTTQPEIRDGDKKTTTRTWTMHTADGAFQPMIHSAVVERTGFITVPIRQTADTPVQTMK
ncbi:hypothetical protein ASPZODRAFT_1935512 [Penicilliopsis zonata CBS 506.65]|uniref:Uncharacterized protein n=1 Tax=Penicilliopsis zonata CBS 506.65 TaxID=1073090 RepID=A0A1L9SJ82_9EURO|nr:hypothetical protein ASPZODRAFT_1935512 [Penicilliopsis zonata CBS 506.65]OJJ47292.1 hypothetical protein ASPZODRAFT_1935512 [Penicilliopsis zonata CBS 506.65]